MSWEKNSINPTKKVIYIVLGSISLVLGVLGAILPVLPTVPFVILAAYLFKKSSPRVHTWLTSLPHIGSAIIDWETNKLIRPHVKKKATISIVIVFYFSFYLVKMPMFLKVALVTIAICVLWFIWTRKSDVYDSGSESQNEKAISNSSID